jgi:hypothetical protein
MRRRVQHGYADFVVAPSCALGTRLTQLNNQEWQPTDVNATKNWSSTFVENKGRLGMIQRTPKTVYVNPQQLKRQREHRDEARKAIVPNPDPVHVLAKAWRIGKLTPSLGAPSYTEGRQIVITVPDRSESVLRNRIRPPSSLIVPS